MIKEFHNNTDHIVSAILEGLTANNKIKIIFNDEYCVWDIWDLENDIDLIKVFHTLYGSKLVKSLLEELEEMKEKEIENSVCDMADTLQEQRREENHHE